MSQFRRFTPTTAIAVVVANMVGTGVFTSLGYQLVDIQSDFVLLLLWFVGGIARLQCRLFWIVSPEFSVESSGGGWYTWVRCGARGRVDSVAGQKGAEILGE